MTSFDSQGLIAVEFPADNMASRVRTGRVSELPAQWLDFGRILPARQAIDFHLAAAVQRALEDSEQSGLGLNAGKGETSIIPKRIIKWLIPPQSPGL